MHQNIELYLARDFVEKTNKNIYLTGKAGTGKTTFLQYIKNTTFKRSVVVAPTGVAAINAGGVTIHSFFQLPFGPIMPGQLYSKNKRSHSSSKVQKFSKKKINMIRSLDLLIIDEISMVRADLLDGIDQVLRRFKNSDAVFGGAQLLMIGDLQQLAPVVKNDEWEMLRNHYETAFFFSSRSFIESQAIGIELKHIYRQENQSFINILNQIRNNNLDEENLKLLNDRYQPDFSQKTEDGYITLTTHNRKAHKINETEIQKLTTSSRIYQAKIEGDFPEYNYPNDEHLKLKVGAQVMFIKNDSSAERKYFNGKIGRITAMDKDGLSVSCPGDDEEIWTETESWHQIKYSLDKNNEIKEDIQGIYTQIPLRLAWAITIHKSQGLTFDRAIIDAEASFAHGQTYVALSRCRTLEGIVLMSRINKHGIKQDSRVVSFTDEVEHHQPDEKQLNQSKRDYQLHLLKELFNFHPLHYYLNRCQKTHHNSGDSLLGHLNAPLKQIKEEGILPLIKVSDSFLQQLKVLSKGEHELERIDVIQDRIRKAVAYYLQQIEQHFSTPLSSLTYSSDNKAILKDFKDDLEEFKSLLAQRIFCLKACQSGFNTQEYLKARAQAIFEEVQLDQKETPKEETTDHPELFKRLRQYRHEKAKVNNIKHYQVFTQKALFDICHKLPAHLQSLKLVHGIGKKKIQEYGDDIVDIVREYCIEIGKKFDMEAPPFIAKEKPKKVANTREISLQMFKDGMNVEEIAAERSLTTGTIIGHLLEKIEEDEIDFSKLMDANKMEEIEESIRNTEFGHLSELYRKLDKKYNYQELKVVLKKMSNS